MNPYERALAYRFLAYASIGQEDSAAAVGYFEKVVEQEALSIDDEASVRFNIAQIYASMGEWQKVEEALESGSNTWSGQTGSPTTCSRSRTTGASKYDEALTPALKALEISNEPKESWLQLVAALHLQKEDFDSAVPILEELVTRFTKKQYWVQLSLIYGARGDYEHALRIQQLAYAQGLLTQDDELRRLARTYLFHQLPYPAAQVLERGLEEGRIERDREVLELLGNSWIAAREYEKSIEPLQQAADLAEDGRLYLRLGQVRVQREDWKEATGSSRRQSRRAASKMRARRTCSSGSRTTATTTPSRRARPFGGRGSMNRPGPTQRRGWSTSTARARRLEAVGCREAPARAGTAWTAVEPPWQDPRPSDSRKSDPADEDKRNRREKGKTEPL